MPTATIITSVFTNTARAYTRLMGVPDFPYLVCPHPITNVNGPALEERAHITGLFFHLAPQVVKLNLKESGRGGRVSGRAAFRRLGRS